MKLMGLTRKNATAAMRAIIPTAAAAMPPMMAPVLVELELVAEVVALAAADETELPLIVA